MAGRGDLRRISAYDCTGNTLGGALVMWSGGASLVDFYAENCRSLGIWGGGGLVIYGDDSPGGELRNITLKDCTAATYGGGLIFSGTKPMTDLTIEGCSASWAGGAALSGGAVVENFSISDCFATSADPNGGGGAWVWPAPAGWPSSAVLRGGEITNCTSDTNGGAVSVPEWTEVTFEGEVMIVSNNATLLGGGVHVHENGTLYGLEYPAVMMQNNLPDDVFVANSSAPLGNCTGCSAPQWCDWRGGSGDAVCSLPSCGDGDREFGEECDDGANANGDGCNEFCAIEFCGDGVENNNGEICDDGNVYDGDGCSSLCEVECPSGQVAPSGNWQDCTECPVNTYAVQAWELCQGCPTGAATESTGSIPSDCECAIGWYGSVDSGCEECPVGAVCETLGQEELLAAPGYWKSPDGDVFLSCPNPSSCPGGQDLSGCSEGYTGFMCADCAPGWYALDGACLECNNTESVLLISVVVVAVLLFSVWKIKSGSGGGTLGSASMLSTGILVNFGQTMVVIGNFSVRWPAPIQALFRWMAVLNFDLQLASPECAVAVDWHEKLLLKLTLPLVFVVLILVGLCLQCCIWGRGGGKAVWTAGGLVVTVLVLLYNNLTLASLDVFRCTEREDGSVTLESSPTTMCYDRQWYQGVGISIAGLVVYTIGLPLVLFFAFRYGSERRHIYDLNGGGKWAALWGPVSVDKHRRKFFWFELVQMGKKLLVIGAMQWDSAFFQTLSGFLLMLMHVIIVAYAMPYGTGSLDRLELSSGLASLLTLFCGIVFATAEGGMDSLSNLLLIFMVFIGVGLTLGSLGFSYLNELPGKKKRKSQVAPYDVVRSMSAWLGQESCDYLMAEGTANERETLLKVVQETMDDLEATRGGPVSMDPLSVLMSRISRLESSAQRTMASSLLGRALSIRKGN